MHSNKVPVNKCGNLMGRMTASLRASFAASNPATSSQRMFGFSVSTAPGDQEEFRSSNINLGNVTSPSQQTFKILPHFRLLHIIFTLLLPILLPSTINLHSNELCNFDFPAVPTPPDVATTFFFCGLLKCSLSFSARSRYSVIFFRMLSLTRSFFSSSTPDHEKFSGGANIW